MSHNILKEKRNSNNVSYENTKNNCLPWFLTDVMNKKIKLKFLNKKNIKMFAKT